MGKLKNIAVLQHRISEIEKVGVTKTLEKIASIKIGGKSNKSL